MNHLLEVCLFALTLATSLTPSVAAQSATGAQTLQPGVSVNLAVTSSAVAMPEADNQDAWIVAVSADGSLYYGIDPVTPSDLADKMKSRPRRRDQKLYVKADARAPFAEVRKVLTAAHEVDFNTAVLLTSQSESPARGAMVPPKGLEVQIGPHSNAATIVVQVNPGQPSPTFEVNDRRIPAAGLEDTLRRLRQNRSDMPVLVKASGPVSFAPIVQAIDACHSIGAKVMLSTPEL
jgi:biopolymer transport protein ExbD